MRKILFRGKRLYNGAWVYGDAIHYDDGRRSPDQTRVLYILPQDNTDWDILEAGYRIDPKTVGQYMEIRDKNGKDIYEGDILIIDGYSYEEFTVEVKNGSISLWGKHFNIEIVGKPVEFYERCTIIGNIHDKRDEVG